MAPASGGRGRPLPGLRAPKGAEARPSSAGKASELTILPQFVSILCTRRYALAPALRLRV